MMIVIPSTNLPPLPTRSQTTTSQPSRLRTSTSPILSLPHPRTFVFPSLFPSPLTYGTNLSISHPLSSSPLPNVENPTTILVRPSAVVANLESATSGTVLEPYLLTLAYPILTPFHQTYTPDFTLIYLPTDTLQTSAFPNPFSLNRIYRSNHLYFNNPIAHPSYDPAANIPHIR